MGGTSTAVRRVCAFELELKHKLALKFKSKLSICLLPSTGPTWAGARAVHAHIPHDAFFTEKRRLSISYASWSVGLKNTFLPPSTRTRVRGRGDVGKSGGGNVGSVGGVEVEEDLWTWARRYERGRRVRKERRERMRAEGES